MVAIGLPLHGNENGSRPAWRKDLEIMGASPFLESRPVRRCGVPPGAANPPETRAAGVMEHDGVIRAPAALRFVEPALGTSRTGTATHRPPTPFSACRARRSEPRAIRREKWRGCTLGAWYRSGFWAVHVARVGCRTPFCSATYATLLPSGESATSGSSGFGSCSGRDPIVKRVTCAGDDADGRGQPMPLLQ